MAYKEAFTIIQSQREDYFAFNYLVVALEHLNNYLVSDIALPFEDKMQETSLKWNGLLTELKDKLIFNMEINQIMRVLIKDYNRMVFEGSKNRELVTEYSKYKRILLKETLFLTKTITTKERKSRKEKINLVLEGYSINNKLQYFYYPKSDYDFMSNMKFLIFHMNLFNRNTSPTSMNILIKKITLDAQIIVDQLFYEGISKSEVSRTESIELKDLYSSIKTTMAS